MVRKFASRLEAIEWLKQSALESEGDLQNASNPLLVNKLAHKSKIIRGIRYCQRCGVRWPCLMGQEEAIERGRIRRGHSDH